MVETILIYAPGTNLILAILATIYTGYAASFFHKTNTFGGILQRVLMSTCFTMFISATFAYLFWRGDVIIDEPTAAYAAISSLVTFMLLAAVLTSRSLVRFSRTSLKRN